MKVAMLQPPTDPSSLDRLRAAVADTAPSPVIRDVLIGAIDALAHGSPVRIEPMSPLVTTSQAAELLNVSRTTLVRLLEDGKIPYQQPNVHRLVRVDDVLAYRQQRSSPRRAALHHLARDAVDDFWTDDAEDLDQAGRGSSSHRPRAWVLSAKMDL